MVYPLAISAGGLFAGTLALLIARQIEVRKAEYVELTLKFALILNTMLATPCVSIISWALVKPFVLPGISSGSTIDSDKVD